MTHAPEDGNRFAPGTFARPSAPASVARMAAAIAAKLPNHTPAPAPTSPARDRN